MKLWKRCVLMCLVMTLMVPAGIALGENGLVELPANTRRIRNNAFYGNSSIVKAIIPEGVYEIGWNAFKGCTGMTDLSLPGTLETIPESCFEACTSLKNVRLANGIDEIAQNAFAGCTSLTAIDIPGSVNWIGTGAFADCTMLSSVTLRNGIELLDNGIFRNCSSLTEISLPASLTYINDDVFEGCDNLTTVHAPENTYAYAWAVDCGYIVPEGDLTVLPVVHNANVLSSEDDVTVWYLPSTSEYFEFVVRSTNEWSVTMENCEWIYRYDEDSAHNPDEHMWDFDVSNNDTGDVRSCQVVFTSGNNTATFILRQLPELTALMLSPESVARTSWEYCDGEPDEAPDLPYQDLTFTWPVVEGAVEYEMYLCTPCYNEFYFSKVPEEEAETIEFTVKKELLEVNSRGVIDVILYLHDAYGNRNYTTRYRFRIVDENNPDWSYGYIFKNDEPVAVQITGYMGDAAEITLPSRFNGLPVWGVAADAFCETEITSCVVPDSVEYLETGVFSFCRNLTSVVLPDGLDEISSYLFAGTGITQLRLPSGIRSIPYGMFYESALTQLVIPPHVQWIGSEAFYNCFDLTAVEIPASVTDIAEDAFGYYEWDMDEGEVENPLVNLTIYGEAGSVAETYATEHEINFVAGHMPQ